MNFPFNHLRDRTALAVGAALLSGCASVGPGAPAATPAPGKPAVATPSLGLFSSIRVPGDREPVLKLSARGAQVFRCEKRDGQSVWIFRQPDAELLDDNGKVVGRHGANFSFEHADGSRLVATIAASDEAPKSTDLRWLLMTTRSYGKGSFENITHVQRVNTQGGMPPERCSNSQTNQVLRVDFTAEFIFYRPRSGAPG